MNYDGLRVIAIIGGTLTLLGAISILFERRAAKRWLRQHHTKTLYWPAEACVFCGQDLDQPFTRCKHACCCDNRKCR